MRRKSDSEKQIILSKIEELTSREYEVMMILVSGGSNKVIARKLNISPNTVELHRAKVMKKMQADTLPELVTAILRYDLAPS